MRYLATAALAALTLSLVLTGCGHRGAKTTSATPGPSSQTSAAAQADGSAPSATGMTTSSTAKPGAAVQPLGANPSVKDILSKTAELYKSAKSLKLSGVQTQTTDIGKRHQEQQTELSVEFARPNKMRMQITRAGNYMLDVSDGSKRTMFDSRSKQFASAPAMKDISQVAGPGNQGISSFSLLAGADTGAISKIAKLAGSEKVNGVDSYVIQYPIPAPHGVQGVTISQKLWIGKSDFLIHKLETAQTISSQALAAHMGGKAKLGGPAVLKESMVLKSVAANETIPASRFHFSPPAGAKELKPQAPPQSTVPKPPPTTGKKAPQFSLTSLDGKDVSMSSFKGKPVVVVFWTSLSATAKQGLISLEQTEDTLKSRGIATVAVTLDSNKPAAEKFVKENKISFPVLMGYDTASKTAIELGVTGMPTAFIVDGSGVIKGRVTSPDLGPDVIAEMSKISIK